MFKRIGAIVLLIMVAIVCSVACNSLESPAEKPEKSEKSEKPEKPVVLYLPDSDAEGFVTKGALTSGSAETIVALLVSEKALPEGCALRSFKISDKNGAADMNAVFGQTVRQQGTTGEYLMLGSLVNTLLTFFQLDTITLTVEGEVLETGHSVYDSPLSFFISRLSGNQGGGS